MKSSRSFQTIMWIALFLPFYSHAQTCTTTTVCDYTTAACSDSLVHDPTFPKVIDHLPFNFSKADSGVVSTCTGNNGQVNCPSGATAEQVIALPATGSYCTYTPSTSLPSTVDCSYKVSVCTATCTASHQVTTCTP